LAFRSEPNGQIDWRLRKDRFMQQQRSLAPPRWGWLVLLSLAAVSCSGGDGKLNPVQGKVLHKNRPLAGALVSLHPKDANDINVTPSTGLTKEGPLR
jgi:hypothetical protein